MSEYQYYEFQAIDRPLTREEMTELRSFSSRARISATRFANEYHWGDFKGNREEWMKRYFDAHLYTSNFGSRVLSFRFPLDWIDLETMRPYEVEGALEMITTRSHFILSFILETDPGEYDEDEDNGETLSALLPIRAALARGDRRALYLGWLSGVQSGLVDAVTSEPPVPPGLDSCTFALDSLIGFLNLRDDLVAAAARNSPAVPPVPTSEAIRKWLGDINANDKDQWLSRILVEDDPSIARDILKQHRASAVPDQHEAHPARSAEVLLSEADDLEAVRLNEKNREKAQKERARILALTGQESGLWQSVIKLSDSSSLNYQDRAILMLSDLRELGELTGDSSNFRDKLEGLVELRRRKSSFMKRLEEAGLA